MLLTEIGAAETSHYIQMLWMNPTIRLLPGLKTKDTEGD